MERAEKIRPHQILQMGDDFGRPYHSFIPYPVSGSMSAFEYVVIVKLINLVDPKRIFEFGTYMGATTKFILENLDFEQDEDRKIFTIDLDSLEGVFFEGDDGLLAKKVLRTKRLYSESEYANKVEQIFMDSIHFDGNNIKEKMDFILIDANHSLPYVRKDTENAFRMLTPSKHVVIWDDYEHPDFTELTGYVDSLARSGKRIFHVEGTQLAILLSDDFPIGKRIEGMSL
jgi:predicted O-methyltransferase YrrM